MTRPTVDQIRLLRWLIDVAPPSLQQRVSIENLHVQSMDDGGMGSLLLFETLSEPTDRRFGGVVSEIAFSDSDGVMVDAVLIIDTEGRLYELDSWKVDSSALIEIPNTYDWRRPNGV